MHRPTSKLSVGHWSACSRSAQTIDSAAVRQSTGCIGRLSGWCWRSN